MSGQEYLRYPPRYAIAGCRVAAAKACSQFVYDARADDVVVRARQASVVFGLHKGSKQCRSRGSGLPHLRFIAEAHEYRLIRGELLIDANVALIASDGRGKVDDVIVGDRVRSAVIRKRVKIL